MAKTVEPEPAPAYVLSQDCTTHYPDLELTLEAGQATQILATHLTRVLTQPGVVQMFPQE